MHINITGGSQSQKKYARSIIKFCVAKMMPRMHNLEINLHIKDFGKDDSLGYAIPSDEADSARPREFDLEVHSKQPMRKLVMTLAHEMVHVKQFARGELYESVRLGRHRWQGEWIAKEPDYWDQPWEIEAHGRECGLFVRWAEKENIGNKKWTKEK